MFNQLRKLVVRTMVARLGPPVVPFCLCFGWEGSPTKIDYRKMGTLILNSLLEDLEGDQPQLFDLLPGHPSYFNNLPTGHLGLRATHGAPMKRLGRRDRAPKL